MLPKSYSKVQEMHEVKTAQPGQTNPNTYIYICICSKVSLLGVDSLWGDRTFIPADWGS